MVILIHLYILNKIYIRVNGLMHHMIKYMRIYISVEKDPIQYS